MSHPFPSLFSSSKKKRLEGAGVDVSGSDSTDEVTITPRLPKPMPPQNRGHRSGRSVGSKDFTTGTCMTCSSLVRWPRELKVFKCTICLTINDLQPAGFEYGSEGSPKSAVPGTDDGSCE
jgi:E3 ubiquitin-protein ligase HECTD2